MKSSKHFITLLFTLALFSVRAQNACFGTAYFNTDLYSVGGQNYVFVQPSFITQPGWVILSQHWFWDDGTDTLYAGTNGVYHNYGLSAGVMDVCLVSTAQQTGTGAICTDTFCHNEFFCVGGTQSSTAEWFYANQTAGLNVNFNAEIQLFNGMMPMHYYMTYGDGAQTTPVLVYSNHYYPNFSHTYAAPGTYVVTLTVYDSIGCQTDTVAAVNVNASTCNINASFSSNQGGPQNTNSKLFEFTSTSNSYPGIASYNWSVLNGSYTMLSNSGAVGSALLNTPLYNYQVQLIVVDSAGCSDTVIQSVIPDTCNLTHTTNYSLSNSNPNNSDTVYYNASFSTSHTPISFKQVALYGYPSNTLVASSTNLNSFFTIPASSATYHLVFYGRDDIGCLDSVVYTLTNTGGSCNINAAMLVNQGGGFYPNTYPYNNNYPSIVTLVSTSTSANTITNYQWSITGGTATFLTPSNDDTIQVLMPTSSSYTITLIVTDNIGCKDTVVQSYVPATCNLTAGLTTSLQNANPANQDTLGYSLNVTTTHLPLYNLQVQCFNQNTGVLIGTKTTLSGNFFVPTGIPCRIVYKVNDDIGCLDSSYAVVNNNSTSCFGTMYFNSMHYNANSVNFAPGYVLNPHWAITSQTFFFGDGTSAAQSPGQGVDHIYSGYSYANVCMAATAYDSTSGTTCSDTFCSYIQMCSQMSLGLSATVNGNSVGATGTFVFYGNNSATYSVNYGDGNTSGNLITSGSTFLTHNFQAHTYQQSGVYLITLTATNGLGCTSDTTIAVIINAGACTANVSFTYQNLGNGVVQFNNSSSSANGYTSQWIFFNGATQLGTSALKNPLFQFSGSGPYTASLMITDSVTGSCFDSVQHVPLNLSSGPSCLVLKPSGTLGKDAMVRDINSTTNYGSITDVNAGYNTVSTQPAISRSYIQFDLSALPSGAQVTSARLSLYHDPAAPHSTNTANDVNLSRVTSAWAENTITWANQPTFTNSAAINIGNTPTTTSDKLNVDVTAMVQGWANGNYPNYGWEMGLVVEPGTLGRFQIYASSDNADSALWPELVVCYNVPSCTANASFTYQDLGGNNIKFTNASSTTNGFGSTWIFYNATGIIGGSSLANPTFQFTGATPYYATLIVQDITGFGCNDTLALQPINLTAQLNCITLQPDSAAGIDAHIFELTPNAASGSWPDFSASQWTYNSIPGEDRGLLKFDLSAIPTGATVNSAYLSLYANTNSVGGYTGQPTYGSNNASYLKLVTSSWAENTVTWATQPTTTTAGEVLLPQATSTVLDYTNLDITSFAQGWVNTPSQNYGMLLDMIGTNYYNSLIFCSSDYPVAAKRPKLVICYSTSPCTASANFSYSVNGIFPQNPDTAVLTNLSSGSIASYESFAHNATTGALYSYYSGTSFNSVNHVLIPSDTAMVVCLVAHDSTGLCTDTFCANIISGACIINPGFTYTAVGPTVTFQNTSTGNLPLIGYYWTFPHGSPSTSTAQNPVVQFTQYGTDTVCLSVSSAGGCVNNYCGLVTTVPLPLNDTLCGLVFNDANSNGILDVGEQPRPNSIVVIDGQNYTTGANGFYHVAVAAGTHSIVLNAPPGWSQTYPLNPLTYSITTAQNDNICGLDFGMHDDTLILSGVVYTDNNNNGLYDNGDVAMANATVNITGPLGTVTAVTNSAGYYSKMVYSGTYNISYTPPSGYSFTQPTNPNYYTLTVVTNGVAGLNFGVRSNNVTISGKVYIDLNNNGVYDNGEPGIANQPVHMGWSTAYTDANGNWSMIKPAGTYTFLYSPSGNYSGYIATPTSILVNATTPGTNYSGNNFGIYIAPNTGDVCVTLNPYTNVVANMPAWYKIYVSNNGTVSMTGTLIMSFDPHLLYQYSSITPTSTNLANYTLSWHMTVPVGQTTLLIPHFTCSVNVALNDPIFNAIDFIPDPGFTDVNMACNSDTLHQLVEASWDPNDKHVSPVGEGPLGLISDNQELDYTITFHNTGNSPAVNIIILDTLGNDIDVNTLEMRDASHTCQMQVEDRVVSFTFSNIMLPDSATNFDSSFGFVSFSAKPVQALPQGTAVNNTASIYFDYNDAIVTNTTLNTIDYQLAVGSLNAGPLITLQPNPFKQYTTIKIEGPARALDLEVYDLLGNVVRSMHSASNIFVLERGSLAAGMYTYQLKSGSQTVGKGKMIAE